MYKYTYTAGGTNYLLDFARIPSSKESLLTLSRSHLRLRLTFGIRYNPNGFTLFTRPVVKINSKTTTYTTQGVGYELSACPNMIL